MKKIDFVIPWVDGNDIEWQNEKNKYTPGKNTDTSESRYRDMDILRYWFRAVEMYAPWVNKIYFITWGHLPEWLNINHPKLCIVNHRDYIPEKYLPTFNSIPIEVNMHRIKGLSEHFVYFNDDMLLNGPVSQEFFFRKDKPCDFAYLDNIYFTNNEDIFGHVKTNEAHEISRHFSYIKSFFKHPDKYVNIRYPLKVSVKNILKLENKDLFIGFADLHLPCAYKKQSFVEAWQRAGEMLERVSYNRFRTPFDVSQSFFRYLQLAKGEFYPVSKKSRGKVFRIENDNTELLNAIADDSIKMICINDTPENVDFEKVKAELVSAYERKLPDKSEFEI